MARPLKRGLDYFPLDCVLDQKFDFMEARFGLKGFAIVVKLFQRIYGQNGYYCEFDEDIGLLFAKQIGVNYSLVSDIVAEAIKRGIFDEGMFEKYHILTSTGIQFRYFECVGRRANIEVDERYLLVSVSNKSINVNKNGVYVYNNPVNADINTQSKGKESKGKERKEKEKEKKEDEAEAVAEVARRLEQVLGTVSPHRWEKISEYVSDGVEPGMLVAAIDEADSHGKRNWAYIEAILKNKVAAGIKTLDGFRRAEADFKADRGAKKPVKPSKFNNYDDSNATNYTALEERILEMMDE